MILYATDPPPGISRSICGQHDYLSGKTKMAKMSQYSNITYEKNLELIYLMLP